MIAYDLKCENGHRFEGWFDNEKSFKSQKRKKLVECPVCSSIAVDRVFSTFGIAKHRGRERTTDERAPAGFNPYAALIKYVQDNFEDVGTDFTKEALKMHYGVSDQRNIRGVSSDQEENILKEEGIEFFKLPVPSPTPSEE